MTRDRSGNWEVNEIRLWVLNTESIYRVEKELAHIYARQKQVGLFNEARALDDITNNIIYPVIDMIGRNGHPIWTNPSIRLRAAKKVLELVNEEIEYITKEEFA